MSSICSLGVVLVGRRKVGERELGRGKREEREMYICEAFSGGGN